MLEAEEREGGLVQHVVAVGVEGTKAAQDKVDRNCAAGAGEYEAQIVENLKMPVGETAQESAVAEEKMHEVDQEQLHTVGLHFLHKSERAGVHIAGPRAVPGLRKAESGVECSAGQQRLCLPESDLEGEPASAAPGAPGLDMVIDAYAEGIR